MRDGELEDAPGPVCWTQALRSLRQGCRQRRQLWQGERDGHLHTLGRGGPLAMWLWRSKKKLHI